MLKPINIASINSEQFTLTLSYYLKLSTTVCLTNKIHTYVFLGVQNNRNFTSEVCFVHRLAYLNNLEIKILSFVR